MWTYNETPELYHYGVKGMKWGVRKKSYDPTATVKKSKKTKALERLAKSGQKHAKIQDDIYNRTGGEYHKRSADQWRRESEQNQRFAEQSYKRDVFNKTANRQQKKEQRKRDEAVSKEWVNAYNRAADTINARLSSFNDEWSKKESISKRLIPKGIKPIRKRTSICGTTSTLKNWMFRLENRRISMTVVNGANESGVSRMPMIIKKEAENSKWDL